MQYSLIIHDNPAQGTVEKRVSVRNQHLEKVNSLRQSGNILHGGAILNDAGDMVGSALIVDFPDQAAVEAFIKADIYYEMGVWQDYHIYPIKTLPPLG
ncbi:MAG: YciI family protein [Alphaproteobacteria bacterium]